MCPGGLRLAGAVLAGPASGGAGRIVVERAMNCRYRADVLVQLAEHGLRPTAATSPERVREFLNDLYRYELRRLRDRLLRREFPKPDYHARVVEVRRRYFLLSMKPWQWLEPGNIPSDP